MELTDGERALMLAEYLRSQDIQIEVNTILELKDIHYKLKIAALQAGISSLQICIKRQTGCQCKLLNFMTRFRSTSSRKPPKSSPT
jgi:hypothetical protein